MITKINSLVLCSNIYYDIPEGVYMIHTNYSKFKKCLNQFLDERAKYKYKNLIFINGLDFNESILKEEKKYLSLLGYNIIFIDYIDDLKNIFKN